MQNCWDFKSCGRTEGGTKVDELGLCPASTDSSHNGMNDGKNAGRYCWKIAGTFCGGTVQGTSASKLMTCVTCEFYKQVKEEAGSKFQL